MWEDLTLPQIVGDRVFPYDSFLKPSSDWTPHHTHNVGEWVTSDKPTLIERHIATLLCDFIPFWAAYHLVVGAHPKWRQLGYKVYSLTFLHKA